MRFSSFFYRVHYCSDNPHSPSAPERPCSLPHIPHILHISHRQLVSHVPHLPRTSHMLHIRYTTSTACTTRSTCVKNILFYRIYCRCAYTRALVDHLPNPKNRDGTFEPTKTDTKKPWTIASKESIGQIVRLDLQKPIEIYHSLRLDPQSQ